MRALQGFAAALVVASVFGTFMVVFLGASWLFALIASGAIAIGILAVVLTRTSERDVAADAAWVAASPDLPPASDRRALERSQIPVPDDRTTTRPQSGSGKRGASR